MSKHDKITATISYKDPKKFFWKALEVEKHNEFGNRVDLAYKYENQHVVVTITTSDGVALRAALSTINKHIMVFEDMEKVQ